MTCKKVVMIFSKLYEQFAKANQLEATNKNILEVLGYGK